MHEYITQMHEQVFMYNAKIGDPHIVDFFYNTPPMPNAHNGTVK